MGSSSRAFGLRWPSLKGYSWPMITLFLLTGWFLRHCHSPLTGMEPPVVTEIIRESCSSIGKNQVPQPSTDTNDIVLKVLYTVAEGMHQNVVALHATDRMLDKDADLTEGFILSLLLNT